MRKPLVVAYKCKQFVFYKCNPNTRLCKLLEQSGKKYSGTPHVNTLSWHKDIELPCVEFNGHTYFMIKAGVFSASTGNKIVHPEIIKLFNKKK